MRWLDQMRAEHEQFRADMLAMEARLTERVDQRFTRVDERMASIQVAIADSKAELMKWSLVFWVSAVGAIAVLAGVLRQ